MTSHGNTRERAGGLTVCANLLDNYRKGALVAQLMRGLARFISLAMTTRRCKLGAPLIVAMTVGMGMLGWLTMLVGRIRQ